ncbi:competence protein ComK [Fervidibacillus halotolerans]|uniref:Competence protein ComK n=1 Tax=Fervidibacillus halotolerans TaxID=2980027 RepID=A0A9E8M0B6_9BACI|nr:competence protein ComK [Fervidibacillus halotolerans]WAA13030.1 competence protein ComK [Fervidibacillus halotolerans]
MSDKKWKLHEEFYLSPQTMAILPIQYGSKTYSKILELNREITTPYKPLDVIKKSCRFYASSYDGRREGTKELIGVTHKAPIVIDPIQSIYVFPTASPTSPKCAWISYEHVIDYRPVSKMKTEVTLQNDVTIQLSISTYSFENQLFRTAHLQSKIVKRLRGWYKENMIHPVEMQMEAAERKKMYRYYSKLLKNYSGSNRLYK